jgi:hypothetical protein
MLNLCLQEAVSEEEEEREEYQLIKSRSKLSFTMSGGEEVYSPYFIINAPISYYLWADINVSGSGFIC